MVDDDQLPPSQVKNLTFGDQQHPLETPEAPGWPHKTPSLHPNAQQQPGLMQQLDEADLNEPVAGPPKGPNTSPYQGPRCRRPHCNGERQTAATWRWRAAASPAVPWHRAARCGTTAPEGPGGLGGNGEPPFIQHQAPSHATLPSILPNCA